MGDLVAFCTQRGANQQSQSSTMGPACMEVGGTALDLCGTKLHVCSCVCTHKHILLELGLEYDIISNMAA